MLSIVKRTLAFILILILLVPGLTCDVMIAVGKYFSKFIMTASSDLAAWGKR